MTRLIVFLLCLSLFTKIQAQFCFTAAYFQVDSMPASVVAADFNNDGNLDLASANRTTNNVSVVLGNGNGSFGSPSYTAVNAIEPKAIISADFNNDGNADLATSNLQSSNVSILLGNGNGTFSFFNTCAFGTYHSICSADFNGDGKADLAGTSVGANKVYVYLGTGTGSFTSAGSYSIATGPQYIITADFNNDGKFDLATANYWGSDMAVLLGNGNGGFNPPVIYPVNGLQPSGITSADFNSDGYLDIATGNNITNNISILLNAGNGTFGTPANYSFVSPYGHTASFATGDFDRDCITDLIVSFDSSSNNFLFFRGNGNGTFAAGALLNNTNSNYTIITADVNKDGAADIISAGAGVNNLSIGVFLNCEESQCTAAIANSYKLINIRLSPNPATTFIDLQFPGNNYVDLFQIRNALGETVMGILGNERRIDVSDLIPGYYFIEAKMKDGSLETTKFVKY